MTGWRIIVSDVLYGTVQYSTVDRRGRVDNVCGFGKHMRHASKKCMRLSHVLIPIGVDEH